MFGEKFLRQATNFYVVASEAAEILNEHRRRFAQFELRNHVLEARSVHIDAGNAVVEKVDQVCVSFLSGNLGQQLLLVLDAVAVALEVIVAREALVQEGGRLAGFTVCLSHTFLLFLWQTASGMVILPPLAEVVTDVSPWRRGA